MATYNDIAHATANYSNALEALRVANARVTTSATEYERLRSAALDAVESVREARRQLDDLVAELELRVEPLATVIAPIETPVEVSLPTVALPTEDRVIRVRDE